MQGNISSSFVRPELLKRVAIYGILTLILGSAQCSFFPILKICPKTPDLIMGMLLAITLIDSPKSAALTALAAGFFIDAIGGGALSLSPVVYTLFVVIISLLSHKMLSGFASCEILMIPALVYRAIATAVCVAISNKALLPTSELFAIILPEALTTAICCLPLYFIVKLCATPLETHGKFTF